jgi:hypothetical protein
VFAAVVNGYASTLTTALLDMEGVIKEGLRWEWESAEGGGEEVGFGFGVAMRGPAALHSSCTRQYATSDFQSDM